MANTYDRASKLKIAHEDLEQAKFMKDALDRIAIRIGTELAAPITTLNDFSGYKIITEVVNSLLTYKGITKLSETLTSESKWLIKRISKVGNQTTEDYATTNGIPLDDKIWDDRTTYFTTPAFTNQFSVSLSGTGQDANGGDIHKYDIAQAFSFSTWVKPNNIAATRIILAKSGSAPSVNGYMFRVNATTGDIFAQLRSSGANRSFTFNKSLIANVYQHIVFTYAGGSNIDGLHVYIDGVKSNTPPSGTLGGTWLEGQDFTLGSRNSSFYFSGLQDEFTAWNKELSQAEVTELYNSGSPIDPIGHSAVANLISHVPILDDGFGSPDASDLVGGFDLTTNGTLASVVP